jgi:signal transduction histidine kinase
VDALERLQMMQQPYVYIGAAALVSALLAYLLWKARPSARRDAAALLTTNLILWLSGEAMVAFSTEGGSSFAVPWTYAVIAWIPFTVHRLVATLDDPHARRHRYVGRLTVAFAIVTLALLPTDLLIAGVTRDVWGFHRVSGPVFPVFVTGLFAMLVLGGGLLVHALRTAPDPLRRLQCQYAAAALGLNIVLGVVNLAVLQPLELSAYHLYIVPLGVTGATVACIYAIARTRLVDVPTVLRRGVLYIALLAGLLIPCLGISLLTHQLATGDVALAPSLVTAALFCVAGFGFPRLRMAAEESLGDILFGDKADHRRLMQSASREVTSVQSLPTLAAFTRETFARALGGADATLWRRHGEGFVALDRADDDLPPLAPEVVARLERSDEPVIVSEEDAVSKLAEELTYRGVELAVGLRVKRRLVGLLTLGRRPDDRLYDNADVVMVTTLANHLAIALENARLYEELRQSRDEVHRITALSAVGTLAAGIAHEVRNPLVAVRTFLELFPDRLNDPEFLGNFGDLALSEIKRIERLISDMLSLARTHERTMEAVDLRTVVEPVARLVGPQAQQRNISLDLSLATRTPPIQGSAAQLEQVILNLVMNAIDASPDGGTVAIRLQPTRAAGGDLNVRLEVEDHGPGIPPDLRDAIFTPFFTTKDSGTGLGLAVAHQIVAEHGGGLSVCPTPGGGATFTVSLPTATPAEHRAAG